MLRMKEAARPDQVGTGRSVRQDAGLKPGATTPLLRGLLHLRLVWRQDAGLKPGATTPLLRGLLHLRLERSGDTRLRFFQMRFGGGVSDLAGRERLFDLPLNAEQARASERGGILGRARRRWNGQDDPDRRGACHRGSGALHQPGQLLEVLALEGTAQTADSSRV